MLPSSIRSSQQKLNPVCFRVYAKISIGTKSDTIKHKDYFHERYTYRSTVDLKKKENPQSSFNY